jgi:hypothetical protein
MPVCTEGTSDYDAQMCHIKILDGNENLRLNGF